MPGALVALTWIGTWGAVTKHALDAEAGAGPAALMLDTGVPVEHKLRPGVHAGLINVVAITLRGHTPGMLRTQVTLAVQRQSGARWVTLQVEGNPGHQTTGAVLAPGRPVVLF